MCFECREKGKACDFFLAAEYSFDTCSFVTVSLLLVNKDEVQWRVKGHNV